METLDKDLDRRDTWLGIRRLKSEYKPQPYHRKTKDGKHIKMNNRAKKFEQMKTVAPAPILHKI